MMRSSNYENFRLLLERLSGVCISCTHGFMQSAHISLHAMFIHLHIKCLDRCLNHCQHMMYGRFQAFNLESQQSINIYRQSKFANTQVSQIKPISNHQVGCLKNVSTLRNVYFHLSNKEVLIRSLVIESTCQLKHQ